MDEGTKRKALVAALTTLVLGAGSYFALSGSSAPPTSQQSSARLDRQQRGETPPAAQVRGPRIRRPEKPAAEPRIERTRKNEGERERGPRTGPKKHRPKKRSIRQPGA